MQHQLFLRDFTALVENEWEIYRRIGRMTREERPLIGTRNSINKRKGIVFLVFSHRIFLMDTLCIHSTDSSNDHYMINAKAHLVQASKSFHLELMDRPKTSHRMDLTIFHSVTLFSNGLPKQQLRRYKPSESVCLGGSFENK